MSNLLNLFEPTRLLDKNLKMAASYELFIYPVENEFISKITIPVLETAKQKSKIATIVILDRSGSMGDEVERFVNRILPTVFEKLDYDQNEKIYLITFDSETEKIETTVKDLSKLDVKYRGCTNMAGAVQELWVVLENLPKEENGVRLLTVSDGEIFDPDETKKFADELKLKVEKNLEINSQAVRLFTSTAQPDTTALSSLLQLNNVNKVELLDLSAHLEDSEISTAISNLFLDDNMTYKIKLEASESIFKKAPWLPNYTPEITLFPGENIFWMSKNPSSKLKIEDKSVQVIVKPEIDLNTYEELLKTKMDYYMTQLRILKVVNTTESTSAINNIVQYFQKREDYILNREEDVQILLNNPGLRSRMQYLKTMVARRNKTFSMRMSQIANDEKVSQLNAAQRADYLRTVENTKLSRGLARRALTQGIDFNEKLREEIKNMALHLEEFNQIDDKNHEESFYSRAKTTDGIRAIVDLVNEDLIDDLDANDILLMINIVGIPCSSPIGDFPDPMTWRVLELHYGWYLSLSDLLTAYVQSNGETFKTPATDKEINNIIPLFEDVNLIRFLRKYAPSLVEYTASVGMRRVIADVPMTCGYTICAALWKMIEDLNKTKTELHLKTFRRLVLNYELYVGGYFKHILPFIKDQNNQKLSYYIANNGITNMISPLITLFRENDPQKLKFVPDILRALYTYEVWQAIRRFYKNRDNSDTIVEEMLTKLLGIDKEQHKTKLKPLYEAEPSFETIKFWDTPIVNKTYLEELSKSFYYANLVALIPKFFSAVLKDEVDKILKVPSLNEGFICQELDVPYNLEDFKLYNIVQALLYTTKSSRVEESQGDSQGEVTGKMKIPDLKFEEEGVKMTQDYIRKQFEQIYLSEVAEKKKIEENQLSAMLVQSIIEETSCQNIIDLFKNGVKRGVIEFKFKNSSTLGVSDLKKKLLDKNENIPLRCDIIRIFLLGRNKDDSPVWNQGNVNFVYNLSEFAKIFEDEGHSNDWDEVLVDYKKRGVHTYREKPNYHGHGNLKPSYYAFGYPSLQHYKNDVSKEDFEKYCSIHHDCCGVPQLVELLKKAQVQ